MAMNKKLIMAHQVWYLTKNKSIFLKNGGFKQQSRDFWSINCDSQTSGIKSFEKLQAEALKDTPTAFDQLFNPFIGNNSAFFQPENLSAANRDGKRLITKYEKILYEKQKNEDIIKFDDSKYNSEVIENLLTPNINHKGYEAILKVVSQSKKNGPKKLSEISTKNLNSKWHSLIGASTSEYSTNSPI